MTGGKTCGRDPRFLISAPRGGRAPRAAAGAEPWPAAGRPWLPRPDPAACGGGSEAPVRIGANSGGAFPVWSGAKAGMGQIPGRVTVCRGLASR